MYTDEQKEIVSKYLPEYGEGETKTTQVVTAVVNLVYGWYNNGDVFDNTEINHLKGWANDISCYANWLKAYTDASDILEEIRGAYDSDYERIIRELIARYLDEEKLKEYEGEEKVDSIYTIKEPYRFVETEEKWT